MRLNNVDDCGDEDPADDDASWVGLESVDILASDFLARYRDGDRPTVDEYARRHPELGDPIRKIFPLVLSVEKVKLDGQSSKDGGATLAGRQLDRLGDFRLIREIGRGGMGIVYEAEQESLGRTVAVKVLPKQSLLDEGSLERFHHEAQMAAAMHHTNIVPIFGNGESDGTHYLVMQLVRGKSLDQIIPDDMYAMSESEIAKIGFQIADAIEYAHENGVLHRDVKPANILIAEDGTAQMTDFGLARNLADDPTTTGALSGSLRYMAPERFRGASDRRSDLYGLGLTLIELLTKRPAFDETDPHELIHAITHSRQTSLRQHRPGLSIDLETILLKAADPDPSLRYPSAGALRDDLARFLADEPIQARRASLMQASVRWCRRNPRLALATLVTGAALTTATVVSTAAYAVTAAANRRSQAALWESEQTLNLAVESLDGVVEAVAIKPVVRDTEIATDDEMIASGSWDAFSAIPDATLVPSAHSAQILEHIQPLYERLSRQAPTRPDILWQMIDASVQLARIQHQLGRTSAAIATLEEGVQRVGEFRSAYPVSTSASQLRLARLNNELGTLFLLEQRFDEADQAYQASLEAADASPESIPLLSIERARSHLALGDAPRGRRSRQPEDAGRLKERRDHLRQAITCLEPLRKTGSADKTVEWMVAKTLAAESRLASPPERRRDRFLAAIEILNQLIQQSPGDATLRFELVQFLADVEFRGLHSSRQLAGVRSRLEQALDELRQLRNDFPVAPVFKIAEVHLRHKLSSIDRTQRRLGDATHQIERAIEIQSSLVDAQSDNVHHRCWRALLYRSRAEIETANGDLVAAGKSFSQAFADIDSVPPVAFDHPFLISTREAVEASQSRSP